MARKHMLFWSVLGVMLALDQGTKAWIRANLVHRVDAIEVIPGFFDLVHAKNPGAAFGMLDDSPLRMWVFGAFTVVAVVVLVLLYTRLDDDEPITAAALGLILSGVVGNAIDRALFQEVTDFLRFHVDSGAMHDWLVARVGMSEWPSFNVADSALFVGALGWVAGLLQGGEDALADPLDDGESAAAAEGG